MDFLFKISKVTTMGQNSNKILPKIIPNIRDFVNIYFEDPLPCSPERNSVSIIRIRLQKVIKSLALNDFPQMNSNNTH
jgi:hypothetical protein